MKISIALYIILSMALDSIGQDIGELPDKMLVLKNYRKMDLVFITKRTSVKLTVGTMRIKGLIQSITDSTLSLTDEANVPYTIPLKNISKISIREEKSSGIKFLGGVLIGGGVLFLANAIKLAVSISSTYGGIFALLGGAIYAIPAIILIPVGLKLAGPFSGSHNLRGAWRYSVENVTHSVP